MERKVLNDADLTREVQTLDGWTHGEGTLRRRYKFPNFLMALNFVNEVGVLAEAADHHPDITFGWGYAEFALTTHDRGGITDIDVSLARQIDAASGSGGESGNPK